MHKFPLFITCPKGILPFLKAELSALNFPVLSEHAAAAGTEGTMDDAMRLNLRLRTAHRVLVRLQEFSAANAEELYRRVTEINWEAYIPEDGYLCVTSSVENPTIRDTRFATLRCKDAIVDRIKEQCGRRPDSGPDRDKTVVHLYWKDDRGAVYLDTSGEPLSRRGYRKIPLKAPLQETLAAAVVIATGWDGTGAFVNPLCGSGTLAIEAALIALHRAPGLLRTSFGFMHLKGYQEDLWRALRDEARKESEKSLTGRIIATDIDPEAVEAARRNAATAGVDRLIEFGVCDFRETPVYYGGGVVVMNPPYGERMGAIAELEETYKGIGDFLKQKCRGYTGYVFTGNPGLAKKVSLKPKRSLPFFNSGIECRLLEYDLYEGTRKIKKSKSPPV